MKKKKSILNAQETHTTSLGHFAHPSVVPYHCHAMAVEIGGGCYRTSGPRHIKRRVLGLFGTFWVGSVSLYLTICCCRSNTN